MRRVTIGLPTETWRRARLVVKRSGRQETLAGLIRRAILLRVRALERRYRVVFRGQRVKLRPGRPRKVPA
jgi:hypothetical protein